MFVLSLFRPHQIKFNDKVVIPQEDHPDVNFVGLIIGPRGSTLKMLEKEVCILIHSLVFRYNVFSLYLD
jgi:hypothetical protein